MSRLPSAHEADIGLLLEGTFPYVSGGVSAWVDQIIRSFPEYRFAVFFLGGRRKDYGSIKYPLPQNLVHVEAHYLQDRMAHPPVHSRRGSRAVVEKVARMHDYFRATPAVADGRRLLTEVARMLDPGKDLEFAEFLYSEAAWDYVVEQYRTRCTDPSFVDYFWTTRTMHAPLWKLAAIARRALPVRAFHSVSTGYAGFLGALLRLRTGRPLVLTEHGIYTKERKIDLFQSDWIKDTRGFFQRDVAEISYFRSMWTRFFEGLGRASYDAADIIIALYEQNRLRQIADGADPARTLTIPNGIPLERYAPLRTGRSLAMPPVVTLIGRVVPIKDVKTFIWAMKVIIQRLPEAQGWIVGPSDEHPEYAQECRYLATHLGVSNNVKFLGMRDVAEILPQVRLVVLSSISEALPLVLLEGFAAGVPAVATDVGACRQLIEGTAGEDAALGPAGRVVRVSDPELLAEAVLALLTDDRAWNAAHRAAIRRVESFYSEARMITMYRSVYQQVLNNNGRHRISAQEAT